MTPAYLNPGEVCAMLGIGPKILRRWVRAGVLPEPITVGRVERWPRREIDRAMIRCRERARQDRAVQAAAAECPDDEILRITAAARAATGG